MRAEKEGGHKQLSKPQPALYLLLEVPTSGRAGQEEATHSKPLALVAISWI